MNQKEARRLNQCPNCGSAKLRKDSYSPAVPGTVPTVTYVACYECGWSTRPEGGQTVIGRALGL